MRLLFSAIGGEGHLRPLLPLARAARDAGHDVLVAGAPALAGVADGLPYAGVAPDHAPHHAPLRPVDLAHERRVVREAFAGWMAEERAAALAPVVREWRPDVVVRDEMDFGAARAAVPTARVVVIGAGGFVPADLVPEDTTVLSAFPASLRDPADPLPPGAVTYRLGDPLPHAGGGVYVTLGTVFNTESGDLFARVLAGVAALGVPVTATVGDAVDPASVPAPDGVRVVRRLPADEALAAADAVVCHGGSGSVLGAVTYGLPLVCLPLGADQPLNAARVESLGAGVALDAATATPRDVREAVERVLRVASYRRAAEALRDEVAALPPASSAVERLAP